MKIKKVCLVLCLTTLSFVRKGLFFLLLLEGLFTINSFAQNTRLWATYYGGTGAEVGSSIATDAAGNVYLAGMTSSTSGIASAGFQNAIGGGYDAFLVKFGPAGNRLWATYYGGSGDDGTSGGVNGTIVGVNIATDTVGNVYLAGHTSSTTGIASGGFQNTYGGGTGTYPTDAYLVKFDAITGNRIWATYYGGTGNESGNSIATDASGNVYLAGYTESASGISSGGFQNTIGGLYNAYLVKFNSVGNRIWATYYGGTNGDVGYGVATDAAGNVYLSGNTNSASGISSGGFQNTISGPNDAFLVKFSASGGRLWATYYGGLGAETGFSLVTDTSSNVYMAGWTNSTSGIASGGFQNFYGGNQYDGFLVKFGPSGSRLWATYYGGTNTEEAFSVTTDIAGNVYLAGDTYSSNGIASGGFQSSLGIPEDCFVAKFDAAGNRICASYYGSAGTNDDENGCVAVDNAGNVYLAGFTPHASGIASGGFQNTFGGGGVDDFLVKFTSCFTWFNTTVSSTNMCNGQCTGTGTANPTNGIVPYTYSWNTTPIQTTQVATGLCAGSYTVIVTDATSATTTATITITQPLSALASFITSSNPNCAGQCIGSATVNATGGAPGYAYSWNTVPVQITANATGLCVGNYTCTITDASGCTDTTIATITAIPSPTVTITGSTIVCIAQNTTLTASGGGTYLWNIGATTTSIIIAPAVTTTYSVTVSVGACSNTTSATVTVSPSPPLYITTGAVSICAGDMTTLNAFGGNTYVWNTGATTGTIVANPSVTTSYTVTAYDAIGCSISDSVTITVSPQPSATVSSATICLGDSAALIASGGTNYSWNTGNTTSTISVSPAATTNYSVIVSIGSCTATANGTVVVNPTPVAAAFSNTTITAGNSTTLSASGPPNSAYSWSNGANGSSITVTPPVTTLYCVTVTDANNCIDTACVTVTVIPELPLDCSNAGKLYLPNVFSPNNDGENDEFCLQGGIEPCIKELEIIIYDRWGEKVYESTDKNFCWDGIYQSKLMNSAVFVYYLEATLISGETITKKGNISLIK